MTTSNLALLCDFYELSMAQGYFKSGKENELCYFDVFFRKVPDGGAYAVFAGLENVLDFIKNLRFEKDDIEYLKSLNFFDESFLSFLAKFKFEGKIYSVCEGEVIFPNEPIMCVEAPAIQAQLLETMLLLNINHQSLIATKTSRIVRAANNRAVLEFGARRAHGNSAALKGARAAFIGGASSTSCTLAAKTYGLNANGTMAHSFVQMFDSELEAFLKYLEIYPQNPSLLIDTYDCFIGLENAILAFKKCGIKECSVRIDSGDLEALSKKIRIRLDEAGLKKCKIIASNSLDEFVIEKLLKNNAPIDAFGVGERLITAASEPIFSGVYKLVATKKNNEILPKMKISQSAKKTTIPHFKRLFRVYDKRSGKAIFDKLLCFNESEASLNLGKDLVAKELLKLVFDKGEILENKSLNQIQNHFKSEISKFDEKYLKLKTKNKYPLKLSANLSRVVKTLKSNLKKN